MSFWHEAHLSWLVVLVALMKALLYVMLEREKNLKGLLTSADGCPYEG
jgi:hypothetical protein